MSACLLFATASQRPPTSWPQLRSLGAGLWLTEPAACRAASEELAKRQFSRHKDPHDAMLMYVALGKKGVVMALFKQVGTTAQQHTMPSRTYVHR